MPEKKNEINNDDLEKINGGSEAKEDENLNNAIVQDEKPTDGAVWIGGTD